MSRLEQRRPSDLRLYGRLLREVRACAWPLAGLLLLGVLATPVALLIPLPLKIAVDSQLSDYPLPALFQAVLPAAWTRTDAATILTLAGMVVVLALAEQARQLASALLSEYTGEKVLLNFRAKLFDHVQRLSFSYHDSKGTADSLYRIQNDTHAVRWMALSGIIPPVSAAVTLAAMIYVIARLDWQLALVALAVSPLLVLTTVVSRRHIRRGWETVKGLDSAAIGVVQETLGGLRVVKAFGQEHRESARFVQQSNQGRRARLRVVLLEGIFGMVVGLIIGIGTGMVLWIGVQHELSGKITVGNLVLVLGYLSQLYAPARQISRTVANMQSSLAGAARAFALLDEAPDVVEKPHARPVVRAAGAITFRDVSFGYNGSDLVLRRLSLDTPAGTTVGITGVTGAGKTTLVNLLSRFYDPTEGQILLDGIDLRDYRLADLRRQFGVVLQEPVLFSTSIAENIVYARPGASEREIIEAAKAAHAHEFILKLPQQYATVVGERGMRLSGGERQRISLARAFLKDAPVLILDEPTSSVDVGTEAFIMEAMQRLVHGRTSLLITHRPTTLAHCDQVFEINQGQVKPLARVAAVTV